MAGVSQDRSLCCCKAGLVLSPAASREQGITTQLLPEWKKGHAGLSQPLKMAVGVRPQKMLYFIPSDCKINLGEKKKSYCQTSKNN